MTSLSKTLAGAIGGFVLVSAALCPAHAALAYNGSAAAAYADQWWNSYNPSYAQMPGDDCTNFVSQALNAGGDVWAGAQLANSANDSYWYMTKQPPLGPWYWSNSFTTAGDLYTFFGNSGRAGLVGIYYPPANYQGSDNASPGDVLFYEWTGDGIEHSAIQVAYGQDPTNSGWYGSLVDQHSSPRYHEIWSLKPTNSYWATTYILVEHHN